jgi:hypothetical protein
MSLQHEFRARRFSKGYGNKQRQCRVTQWTKEIAGTRYTAWKIQANLIKHIRTNLHTGRGTGRSPSHRSHTPGNHKCSQRQVSGGTGLVTKYIQTTNFEYHNARQNVHYRNPRLLRTAAAVVKQRRSLPQLTQPIKEPLQGRTKTRVSHLTYLNLQGELGERARPPFTAWRQPIIIRNTHKEGRKEDFNANVAAVWQFRGAGLEQTAHYVLCTSCKTC